MTPRALPATLEHAEQLAPILRDIDLEEIRLVGGLEPLEALRKGLTVSEDPRAIVTEDNRCIAMFGVAGASLGIGLPWLLCSDELFGSNMREFTRWTLPWVEDMSSRYPFLFNYIHKENRRTIRWLRWCGFTVHPEPMPWNPQLLLFERKASCVSP